MWQLSNKLLLSWLGMSRIRIDMICQNWGEENHILIRKNVFFSYHLWLCHSPMSRLKVKCNFPSLHFPLLTTLLIANWLLRHFSQIYFTAAAEKLLFSTSCFLGSFFFFQLLWTNVCAMVFYLPENYSSPCSICFWWPVHTPLAFMAQQFGSDQLAKTPPSLLICLVKPKSLLVSRAGAKILIFGT